MLTRRRSATAMLVGAAAIALGPPDGAGTLAPAPPPVPSAVAHSAQNFAVGALPVPQAGQATARRVAHSVQNFAPAGFAVPQLEQINRPPAWVRRAEGRSVHNAERPGEQRRCRRVSAGPGIAAGRPDYPLGRAPPRPRHPRGPGGLPHVHGGAAARPFPGRDARPYDRAPRRRLGSRPGPGGVRRRLAARPVRRRAALPGRGGDVPPGLLDHAHPDRRGRGVGPGDRRRPVPPGGRAGPCLPAALSLVPRLIHAARRGLGRAGSSGAPRTSPCSSSRHSRWSSSGARR